MTTQQQLLGEGAYAKVYSNHSEAIKITPVKNEEDLTAIVREQYVLRMELPHMVPMKDFYYRWGAMHITMEKADTNLNRWFRRQNEIPKDKIKKIACQILQGVFPCMNGMLHTAI